VAAAPTLRRNVLATLRAQVRQTARRSPSRDWTPRVPVRNTALLMPTASPNPTPTAGHAARTRSGLRRACERALVCASLALGTFTAHAGGTTEANVDTKATRCPPAAQLPTRAQLESGLRNARDRGFLWRLERDGQQGWLFGTLHVARMAWSFPGPQLGAALRNADVIALELDLLDPAVQRELSAPATASGAQPDLPQTLARRLQRQIEVACVPESTLSALPPTLQVAALTALAGRDDGLDPAYAIDVTLASFGHSAGKRVVSLETVATQMAALGGGSPGDALRFVEQSLGDLESGRARPQVRRIADVWARGDLQELERYEQWCECVGNDQDRALMRRLLDERNRAMLPRIEALLREGRVLVAVGSLHLIGPAGLPALLSTRGWNVQRVLIDTR